MAEISEEEWARCPECEQPMTYERTAAFHGGRQYHPLCLRWKREAERPPPKPHTTNQESAP